MKFGFVFQKDSHYKAVQATATRILKQYPMAQGQFFAIDAQFGNDDLPSDTLRVDIDGLEAFSDCDFLVCCLGGYLLNRVIDAYQHSDAKVIALFPGIVSHYQLDAFISRFNADQVWLNCPADYELYAKLCQVFGVRNNSILYGASWFVDMPRQPSGSGGTIFFEQTQIINNAKTAQQIESQLIDIIKKNPDKLFIYKLRQNIHNDYLVMIRQRLTQFANVQMVSVLSDEMIVNSDTFLSISSSAVVEGLLLGKRSFLLGKRYLDVDGLEFFKKSNLFLNAKPNPNWLRNRVLAPTSVVMIETVVKQSLKKFNQRSYGLVLCKIVLLARYCPKLLRMIGELDRIKAIQKSLEYL